MADHRTISRLSVKVRTAGARDVGDWMTHNPERRKENAKEGGAASCAPVSISGAPGACIDGMAVVNGKWDTERDWRARSIFVRRLLVSKAI